MGKSQSEKASKKMKKKEMNQILMKWSFNKLWIKCLEYDEALKLDNTNFLKTYWYLLKRERIIIYTFFYWNDFNLFAILFSI